jgi:hypothetical protein
VKRLDCLGKRAPGSDDVVMHRVYIGEEGNTVRNAWVCRYDAMCNRDILKAASIGQQEYGCLRKSFVAEAEQLKKAIELNGWLATRESNS